MTDHAIANARTSLEVLSFTLGGLDGDQMLDVVLGTQKHPQATQLLRRALGDVAWSGTLYIGYPVLSSIEGPVSVDGLLCTAEHGIVVLDLEPVDPGDLQEAKQRQDELYGVVFQRLFAAPDLRAGRSGLTVEIRVVSVDPQLDNVVRDGEFVAVGEGDLIPVIEQGTPLDERHLQLVNAAIERVTTLKPRMKRASVARERSRGAILKHIEREIANLDRWQKHAAIEFPEGPQRIRGLAGSGKTIVLALKAAYLHANHPDWKIGLTFHTRSLYQQFRELLTRFSYDALNDEPDWDRLTILHSWGSASEPGIYSTLARQWGHPLRNFGYAKNAFGYNDAFRGVCDELLDASRDNTAEALFDVILIDEAQDLPRPFFELCYLATTSPHRVVFAYDELQNLTQHSMPDVSELFGSDNQGRPRVASLDRDASPREDIILPICYRNTPWALSIAHALGFGIYRDTLVQFFDNAGEVFEDIGYEVVEGVVAPEQRVVLRRSRSSYPQYFDRFIAPDDALSTHVFASAAEQAEWVSEQISRNLTEDELEIRDILVVLCRALTQKSDAAEVMSALSERAIAAHLVGVTSSVDEVFRDQSIALSGIFRAKGNEAPMVYVLHAEYGAASALELIRRRNTLFTGITRSRGWVRLCGVGEPMEEIQHEVSQVVKHEYQLDFVVPSEEEQARLRRIHRDLNPKDRKKIDSAEQGVRELVELIEQGALPAEAVPDDLIEAIDRIRRLREDV